MFDLSQRCDVTVISPAASAPFGRTAQSAPRRQTPSLSPSDHARQSDPIAAPNPPLRRPRLLIRAATAGQLTYERGRDLRALLGGSVPSPHEAVARLEEAEEREEARRLLDSASYSPQRHVALLTALLAEQRLVRAAEQAAGPACLTLAHRS